MLKSSSGIVPDNWLPQMRKSCNRYNSPSSDGILPLNLFWKNQNSESWPSLPNSVGNGPVNSFPFTRQKVRNLRFPSSLGKLPWKLFSKMWRPFRSDISPMRVSNAPLNKLSPMFKFINVIVSFSKYSTGMVPVKLFPWTSKSSKCLRSAYSAGSVPVIWLYGIEIRCSNGSAASSVGSVPVKFCPTTAIMGSNANESDENYFITKAPEKFHLLNLNPKTASPPAHSTPTHSHSS